jgi:hypothetical protein
LCVAPATGHHGTPGVTRPPPELWVRVPPASDFRGGVYKAADRVHVPTTRERCLIRPLPFQAPVASSYRRSRGQRSMRVDTETPRVVVVGPGRFWHVGRLPTGGGSRSGQMLCERVPGAGRLIGRHCLPQRLSAVTRCGLATSGAGCTGPRRPRSRFGTCPESRFKTGQAGHDPLHHNTYYDVLTHAPE